MEKNLLAGRYAAFRVLLGVFLCLFPVLCRAEKLAELHEPFKFPAFTVGEDRIYVWDSECVVHMYARKDFKLLGTFGRKGQGPAEFEWVGYIHVLPNRLCIGQGQKVSYFSKDGKYLSCVTNPNPTTGGYMALGENFVGTRYLPSEPAAPMITAVISMFGPKFDELKRIYQTDIHKAMKYNPETSKQDIFFVRDCLKYEVFEDKLFIGDSTRGFFFSVFDNRGERLYDINRNCQKQRITSADAKKMLAELREALGEQEFQRRKSLINDYLFPDYYPAYADFAVADKKIYVFSCPIPDRPTTLTVLDLRGNLVREISVTGAGLHRAAGSQSYCVHQGSYYYLVHPS